MDHAQKPMMKAQIPQLKLLQDIDKQVFRWTKERREKPKALDAADREVAAKKAEHDAKAKDVDAVKKEVAKREEDLKEREERRKRLEAQRDQSKSNKEYQGYNFEIAAAKAEGGKIEEEILKLMNAVEEASAKVAEAKAVLDQAAGRHGEAKKVVDAELSKIDEELKSLRDRRAAAAAEVHPDYLKMYDRIHKAKPDAVALAAAIKEADGWHCGGCRMDVNFQEVNVIMKGKDPVICRSCSRILYLDSQPQTVPAK